MSIVQTINDEYHFWNWLGQSDSYKNNFSLEGAKAVQAWFDELSESQDEPIEFDPIAWCCEFTEYDSEKEALKQYGYEYRRDLEDRTTVIDLDNGHIILGEF